MTTFQDLQEVQGNEKQLKEFIISAISEYKNSKEYQIILDTWKYYSGENPTIHKLEKIVYDMKGLAHKNMWTANHKIASNFFGFVVDQQVSYLLGNGISFSDDNTKKKLGKRFDQQVYDLAIYAQNGGVSFGFWNYDHLEKFNSLEFLPLYDEETSALKAGIRFWQIDYTKPLRVTLYELDGYTEYIQRIGEELEVLKPKRPYILVSKVSNFDGTEIIDGRNYPNFPIIPLKNNERQKPELWGKRNTIDALDLITSQMVNNADEGNLIYWVLQNCDGMDDIEALEVVKRIKSLHLAYVDDAPEGAKIEPHTVEAPFAGTEATVNMLERRAYKDFQAFNAESVTAGNQTATAIRAAYLPLDLKTDKFETQVTSFILDLLEIAGIDDEPTYTRNQIINKNEEIQSVLLGATYFDDEYITKKLLTVLGDSDQYEEIQNRKMEVDINRFSSTEPDIQDKNIDVNTPDEAVDDATDIIGKSLNGAQTQSLIQVITQLQQGVLSEGQAIAIISTAIGVSKEEARNIVYGD